jgi:hypothetical protein
MLATVLIWLYTFVLCYVYGFLFLKSIRRLLQIEAGLPAFPLIVVAGLIALTTLASFFSLFFQIGLVLNLLLVAGAMVALLTRRIPLPRIDHPWAALPLILLVAAVLVVLENATHRPLNPDTNIYHAQAIHWIESYPAVPGLGNLHGRLAFNSAWFVSNALFGFSFLGLRSFHLTGSVLFLAVVMYFWGGFAAIMRGEYKPSAWLKVLFFPLSFSLLGAEISSPGSDLPTSLLLWLMAVLWSEHSEQDQPFHPSLIVLMAVFALTVKLSAVPVLLLALLVLGETILHGQKRLFAGGMAACAALILLPFLARNIILSGYLLYPFSSLDLFSFDWKVPLERVASEQLSIRAWALFPRMDAARALAMPFSESFPKWLADQTINRRLILFAALLSLPVAVAALWAKACTRRYWFGWWAFYLGTLFWLFNAPDFRFGYGFLIPAILLAFVPWLTLVLNRTTFSTTRVSTLVALLVIAYLGFTLSASFEARSFAARLLLPADYDRVPTQACALANGSVFCAKAYNACSYQAFPCIPAARPWVELRGVTFRDGFRAVP